MIVSGHRQPTKWIPAKIVLTLSYSFYHADKAHELAAKLKGRAFFWRHLFIWIVDFEFILFKKITKECVVHSFASAFVTTWVLEQPSCVGNNALECLPLRRRHEIEGTVAPLGI